MMPKNPKQQRNPKNSRGPFELNEAEQAKQFLRSLQWLNRILDILIQILESQLKFGATISPGTKNLVPLCVEFKERAIREGFEEWFPESEYRFSTWYKRLEAVNRELTSAKKLAHDKEECQARLGRAERAKRALIDLFPKFLNVSFAKWFWKFFYVDDIIERLDAMVRTSNISQLQLNQMLGKLKKSIDLLNEVGLEADDGSSGGQDDEVRVDLKNMQERCQFLLDVVKNGDWRIEQLDDRRKIRRILRELRSQKRRVIGYLGDYGGKSVFDWYKALFDIDFHINNAADLWVDGQILPEWDPQKVIKIIRNAEQAKIRLIGLFPLYLGINLAWFYDHLYQMDVLLDLVLDLLEVEQIVNSVKALKKVRKHKHSIEEVLETYF